MPGVPFLHATESTPGTPIPPILATGDIMNAGKRRRPVPVSGTLHCLDGLYSPHPPDTLRQVEGFARKPAAFLPTLTATDYTTLFCRIQRLDLPVPVAPQPLAGDAIIAVESTRIQVTNRGGSGAAGPRCMP